MCLSFAPARPARILHLDVRFEIVFKTPANPDGTMRSWQAQSYAVNENDNGNF